MPGEFIYSTTFNTHFTELFAKTIRTPPPMQSVAYSNSSIGSYQPVLGGAVIQPTNQVQIPNAASAVKQNKLPPQILPKVCRTGILMHACGYLNDSNVSIARHICL